ncbi:AAA family ATPase [Vibrio splendidus]|nr:AAA family ATPase [Vibrio splendidus]
MINNELIRFMQTLADDDVAVGIRKIANLVFDHLDTLEPLGTALSRRAKKVVDLTSGNWDKLSDVIAETATEDGSNENVIKQLKSISVGPFRGFAKEETLNLYNLLVLIYGPNGAGKSSFCEALEFGLLGAVEEAQSKRFTPAQYLKNAHVNRYAAPVIKGVDSKDKTVVVLPNESLYRFCFVEKNRIDGFSRIAAQAPAKQTELISSLFGLESFNSFVKKFSRELDERHIDLVGEKGLQLKEKRLQLAVHYQTITANQEHLKVAAVNEQYLAKKLAPEISFQQMLVTLGSEEQPGKIQALDAELQKKQQDITDLYAEKLEESKAKVEVTHQSLRKKSTELAKASESLSFKQLYGAVLDLQGTSKSQCPACKTPLEQVAQNPFVLATTELEKLGHLAKLEAEKTQAKTEFSRAIQSVHTIVSNCVKYNGDGENLLIAHIVDDSTTLGWSWWEALNHEGEEVTPWILLVEQVKHLEKRDVEAKQANEERKPIQEKLKKLRELKEQATKLQAQRTTYEDAIKNAQKLIGAFDEENKELIIEAETEKAVVEANKQIASSYKKFVDMLFAYKDQLPSKLVADLGELVVQLYNAFNRYDAPKDQLAVLKLPLISGERIEISYQSEPTKFFDALHVLSEGHIRCIGLSILLAKNLKTNSPLLIFDDPVNAIDDEHRKAIRETLYKDEFFKEKQIILACHGEEFLKNIHQDIGKKAARESATYKFLPQRGESHIQVASFSCPPNYVLAATTHLESAEYRNALASSRRALEHLSDKAWHHYGKHCDKRDDMISVSKRAPHLPHDLRALAENLKAKISRSKADIPNKLEIIGAFESLLGVNGQDPHWLYLNKGTHEETDRDEFEYGTVETIVSSLDALDKALLG